MENDVRVYSVGAAQVSLINVGDLTARLEQWDGEPPDQATAEERAAFSIQLQFPMQCMHIALDGHSVLVDVSSYEEIPNSIYAIEGYQPPAPLLDQLEAIGVHAGQVTEVAITHMHFDHYNGTTHKVDGVFRPAFPNALHYIGRGDLESSETQEALRKPGSLQYQTVKILQEQGLVEAVDGTREIAPGITLISSPGESDGHQLVRIHSQGQTIYCVGDLFHHPLEIRHPEWMASWAHSETMLASRRALLDAALAEEALLMVTHVRGLGRLVRTDTGVDWVPVEAS